MIHNASSVLRYRLNSLPKTDSSPRLRTSSKSQAGASLINTRFPFSRRAGQPAFGVPRFRGYGENMEDCSPVAGSPNGSASCRLILMALSTRYLVDQIDDEFRGSNDRQIVVEAICDSDAGDADGARSDVDRVDPTPARFPGLGRGSRAAQRRRSLIVN
jgi:hypothetical protein